MYENRGHEKMYKSAYFGKKNKQKWNWLPTMGGAKRDERIGTGVRLECAFEWFRLQEAHWYSTYSQNKTKS